VLVRPDGYAGLKTKPNDSNGLRDYFRRILK
jgi:hypothetical protein